jgi:N-acetylglucosaminyldiphosphoundecaprenol N-acetyl-beta-D-mannosaminyltransferase
MEACLAEIERLSRGSTTALIVTADASALVMAHDDPVFGDLLRKAAMVTADGAGVVWALKRKGVEAPERVSGADLVLRLCEMSADLGLRIVFLGAEPGVAERAAESLRLRVPGVNIVGARHGYFPPESDAVVAQEVAAWRPDVLLVGMGMPRQERFIVETASVIGAKVAIGVGGSFDVYSGKTRRAPVVVQRMRLEWLWRLALNPRKISKVRLLPRFVRLVMQERR